MEARGGLTHPSEPRLRSCRAGSCRLALPQVTLGWRCVCWHQGDVPGGRQEEVSTSPEGPPGVWVGVPGFWHI